MSNESIPAASGSQYVLVEGKIYRGDALVATLREDGSVDYAPDMARYRAPVVRFLKGLEGAASPDAGEAEAERPEEPVPPPSEELPEAENPVDEAEESEEAEADGPDFSKAPEQDWRGDKTPAFVDWFYENYPVQAARRYAGRHTHRNFEERVEATREAARSGVV